MSDGEYYLGVAGAEYIDETCPKCGARMIRATITGLFDTGAGGWQVDYCGEGCDD